MIPATDEGLIRGDGGFEVVRVYDGKLFALDQHLARLERSVGFRNLRLEVDLGGGSRGRQPADCERWDRLRP